MINSKYHFVVDCLRQYGKATAEDEKEWVDEDLELFKRSRQSQKNRFSSNAMSTSTVDGSSSTVLAAAASDKVETVNQKSAKQGNPMMPNFYV